jgi:septum formation protein
MPRRSPTLILASASPRRAEILRRAGIPFRARAAHVDETILPGETPGACVRRLARLKAEAVSRSGEIVLGADTVVVAGGRILGKPRNARDAARMLRLLSGRAHEVITGICLLRAGDARSSAAASNGRAASGRVYICDAVTTRVWFRRLSRTEIAGYVASGEPMDKAGAYAIQGLASKFVTRIEGCYFNVVGLPVSRVWEILQRIA